MRGGVPSMASTLNGDSYDFEALYCSNGAKFWHSWYLVGLINHWWKRKPCTHTTRCLIDVLLWYLASSRWWTHSTSYHTVISCLYDFGNCIIIFPLFFLQSPRTGSKPPILASTSSSPAVPLSPQIVAPLECDWSEHTCPDGYKYYYNCVTYESRVNRLHWIIILAFLCWFLILWKEEKMTL